MYWSKKYSRMVTISQSCIYIKHEVYVELSAQRLEADV